jgi:PelA/Pel-15E family pectate lyase
MIYKWTLLVVFVFGVIIPCRTATIIVSKDGKGHFNSIQAAIDAIPADSKSRHTIVIKSGVYHEKVFIAKNNIHLKGEKRPVFGKSWSHFQNFINGEKQGKDGVIIIFSQARDIHRCTYADDWGAAIMNIKATDVTLENLTMVNDYGFKTIENRYIPCNDGTIKEVRHDGHQFALRCMPSTQRFEAIHCNFYSKGGDTVSPWDVENGTFYFKNCTIEGGVDMYCPRGWAYAEDCHFVCHNLNAAIWHDGTMYESSKSVLKNCSFEGDPGYKLGRYHRPAQIFLIGCSFSRDMADADIYQVNKDSMLQWGRRVYYFDCKKEGGDYAWHKDNIDRRVAQKITRQWTLGERWNEFVIPTIPFDYKMPGTSNSIDSIAERVLFVQRQNGGWPKTLDGKTQPVPYTTVWSEAFLSDVFKNNKPQDATIDNGATTREINILGAAYAKTKNMKYKAGAEKGLRYLLSMQYDNGGFPQFFPDTSGYRKHITYNDNAMVNVLELFKKIVDKKEPFDEIGQTLSEEISKALQKGIDCIIKTQLNVENKKTIWGAQHDKDDLKPAKARIYEHPSYAVSESATILNFLMSINNPDVQVRAAIMDGVTFLDKIKIKYKAVKPIWNDPKDYELIDDKKAVPLWARFYEITTLKPIFSGRDGIVKYDVSEIERERRSNYKWYGDWCIGTFAKYEKWVTKWVKSSTEGITLKKDTSYNLNTAYKEAFSKNKNIKWPVIARQKFILKSNVIYKDREGVTLRSDIYMPSPDIKINGQVIIMIHGGGWRSGDKNMHADLCKSLAGLGYICLVPEYRLSTHALYPAAVQDLTWFVSWAKTKIKEVYEGPSDIAIMGFSAGAQLASLIAQKPQIDRFCDNPGSLDDLNSINGLINLDGIMAFLHPESGEGDDSKKKSAATLWFGYDRLQNPALWKEASPLTYAGKHSPPTLFINSSIDRMHAGRNEYISILDTYGIYHEIFELKDAPHSFVFFNPWFDQTVDCIHRFLIKIHQH